MKKIIIIILLLFIIANFCIGQNLVLNPSFEIHDTCPYYANQIEFSKYWGFGAEYSCSSEYYNKCMLGSFIAVPYILKVANEIEPHTSNAFAGILTYYYGSFVNAHNYREAVSSKLLTNLDSNRNYCVSFYVKFAGYWFPQFNVKISYAINKVGALICPDSIIYSQPGDSQIVALDPQIIHSGNVLKDSINWIKISGSFISQGNEKWIHIANFSPDDSTQLFLLPNLTSFEDSALFQSYYLIDDVAVYPCDAPVYVGNARNDTCINPGNSVTIGTAGHSEYLYWWYDEQGNLVDTTAQITVYPTQTTTYILVQKDFKFDETRDTVTVTVDAHCYEVVIPEIRIPNVISPNGDGINDKFVIENGKFYNMKLNIFNRWGNQIFESNDYQNNWPASEIADGVYFYILTSTNPKQEVKEYKGSVSVVR